VIGPLQRGVAATFSTSFPAEFMLPELCCGKFWISFQLQAIKNRSATFSQQLRELTIGIELGIAYWDQTRDYI